MKLYLIRHGNTAANEKRLYYGSSDLPLSEAGRAELSIFKSSGLYPSADLYYTSGLLRTVETLRLLYGDVPYNCIPGLAEYHFGDFELKSYEELKDRAEYQAWIEDSFGRFSCPGGESRREFTERVLVAFEDLLRLIQDEEADSAVCICHGGAISVIMESLLPGWHNFYEWQPAPGHGYCLEFKESRFHIYTRL